MPLITALLSCASADVKEAYVVTEPSFEEQNLAQLSGIVDMWRSMALPDQLDIIAEAQKLMKDQYQDEVS